jgi:DsbC/DsbD-like thiol-disulfide interchange protein
MKLLKAVLLVMLGVICVHTTYAQAMEDPTSWKYEVKHVSGDTYDIIFELQLNEGWHIWSMTPGGDGYEIPPSFTFDKLAGAELDGKVTEEGNAVTTNMEGVDNKVTYFSGKVTYVQHVKVTGKGKITGQHEYQVCNDRMCLPPRTKEFKFEL